MRSGTGASLLRRPELIASVVIFAAAVLAYVTYVLAEVRRPDEQELHNAALRGLQVLKGQEGAAAEVQLRREISVFVITIGGGSGVRRRA
jgi:hypothetical protein